MPPQPTPMPGKRVFYGWIIVGLSFTTLAFHVITRFSFGIFQVPLIEEFGWSRGLLGGAFAVSLGTYAIGSPYTGSLLDRFGPRRVMPWGSVVIGLAFMAAYFISSIWHVFVLIGFFGGAGLALSGFSTHSAILPRWFIRKRGRATGISLAGIGIGILVLSPIIERTIAHMGWRAAYLILGGVILLILAPANFLLMRDFPEEVGQGADGLAPRPLEEIEVAGGHGHASKGVREVFLTVKGDSRFWSLIVLVFTIGLNVNTIMSQLQLYLVDIRYGTAAAALIFGAVGFIRTVGSVAGGWLGDLIGRGNGAAAASGVVAVGLVLLMLIPALGGGFFAGYLFALVYGIGVGAMSACYSALAGDCFEGPSFGVIMGFMEICYGLGGVVGPPFAGLMFDLTGSYHVPFTVIVASMVGSVFLGLWLQKNLKKFQHRTTKS